MERTMQPHSRDGLPRREGIADAGEVTATLRLRVLVMRHDHLIERLNRLKLTIR